MAKNNFELTLDTLAPEGSIARPAKYVINANGKVTIVKGDATHMKVWFDTEAIGTKGEESGYASASWEAAATEKDTSFTTDGSYFYHLVLRDAVANESEVFNSEVIIFDRTAPGGSLVISDADSGSTTITNDRVINYELDYNDVTSGVASAVISGEHINTINLTLDGNGEKTGQITIKDSAPDGTILVSVVLTDVAGNVSTAIEKSIVLDTITDKPVLVLETADNVVLQSHINFYKIQTELSSKDADVVGYKIWEGTEPAEWQPFEIGTAFKVEKEFVLSTGEGEKVIHAKIKDAAGTVVEADARSVIVDTTAPNISLSSEDNKTLISAIEGYNSAKLKLTAEDSAAGIASYDLKLNGATFNSGSEVPGEVTILAADLTEGDNKFILSVTDKAGNTATTPEINIVLDTKAPEISVPDLNEWYKETFGINLTYGDSHNISGIYVWSDVTASSTEVPSGTNNINASGSPLAIDASKINFSGRKQSATNYLHVKVIDEVGNASYVHKVFGFDDEAPEKPTLNFEYSVYTSTTATVKIHYSATPDVSGVAKMKVNGDITNGSEDWETAAESKLVTFTSGDGIKSVTVQVMDTAGNISEVSVPATCEVDTSEPKITALLYKADGITLKPAVSAEADCVIKIEVEDDQWGNLEYNVYGDFAGSDETTWTVLEHDAGKASKSIPVTAIAPTDGKKALRTFYVKIRDNADHVVVTHKDTLSFYFDPTEPEVDVSNLDYSVISKVHVKRKSGLEDLAAWADEVTFRITPSELITAYKVCAYLDEAAAAAGSHEDAAIGTTGGSSNMSAMDISVSEDSIDCRIRGADYEAALGEAGTVDGAHIVVVYVRNEAGLWSASAFKTN